MSAGHEIYIIDNESTGSRNNIPKKSNYFHGSINKLSELEEVFSNNINVVYHIAGQVSLIDSFNNPVHDLRTNVEGTINIIKMCLKYKIPRLLYASSMTVYCNEETKPFSEDARCNPISYYGITKYAAERYILNTVNRNDLDFQLNATIFRMFNVYGPKQALDNPYQGVLGIFIGNILRNEPINIFGDGEQTRDFIYIDDIVEAWIAALSEPQTYGQVINLGSGSNYTVNYIAKCVIDSIAGLNVSYPINKQPARSGEQRHVSSDITVAKNILDWNPKTEFNQGLEKTINWAKHEIQQDEKITI